jgi:hypothetical protein
MRIHTGITIEAENKIKRVPHPYGFKGAGFVRVKSQPLQARVPEVFGTNRSERIRRPHQKPNRRQGQPRTLCKKQSGKGLWQPPEYNMSHNLDPMLRPTRAFD